MQVLVKVAPDKWAHALNQARREDPRVNFAVQPETDILVKAADEFRRIFSRQVLSRDKASHDRHLARFLDLNCHYILAKRDNVVRGGYMILSGELMGLWHYDRGHGDWLLRDAIDRGADRCDYFDLQVLSSLYKRNGFREVLREPNTNKGGPDVVWCRLGS